MWLGHAIRLFCHSFHQADTVIRQSPGSARVSDYQEYLTHGGYLQRHMAKLGGKLAVSANLQAHLEATISQIKKEIANREPGSSQESVTNCQFQISIFDKTYSSSSSAESATSIKPPSHHRPPPLPLGENDLLLDRYAQDSPMSIGTATPGYPKIVDHDPHSKFPPHYEYDDQRMDIPQSVPMRPDLSGSTARARSPSPEGHESEWKTVEKKPQKPRKPRFGRRFGTSKPRPSGAILSEEHAIGSVAKTSSQRSTSPGASSAVESLHAYDSPTGKEQRNGASPVQNASAQIENKVQSQLPKESPKRSWATIAKQSFRGITSSEKRTSSTTSIPNIFSRSRERGRPSQASSVQGDAAPRLPSTATVSNEKAIQPPRQDSVEAFPPLKPTQDPNPPNSTDPGTESIPIYQTPAAQVLGPNSAPIPYEANITIS